MVQPRFQLIPGARLAGATGTGGVGWRLLGANNRELGRSAGSYPDAEDAHESISRVRDLAESGEAHIVHDRSTSLWAWHLDDSGVLVANSGRGFRHERECRYNLDQFRAAAPNAPASDAEVPHEFPWQRTSMMSVQPEATA